MYEIDQNTVSLLHFEDGIKDESGKVWTAQNGATISNAQSKFGGSSLYLNGINQYLTTLNSSDFDFGSNDFTIDWWEYRTSSSAAVCVYNRNLATTSYAAIKVGHAESNGQIVVYMSSTGSNADIANGKSMGTVILNVWTHYAVSRNGNNFYTFQNGILQNTWTSTLSIASSPNGSVIGKNDNLYFNGYIDEFRISKIARWTTDFDPNAEAGKALLVVTMSDEIQKEYELTKAQINDFITWYNNRATGTGLPHYTFNKTFNLGPFQSRKDYLVFDKIQNFEVMEYTK